jgi:hypothetical protein
VPQLTIDLAHRRKPNDALGDRGYRCARGSENHRFHPHTAWARSGCAGRIYARPCSEQPVAFGDFSRDYTIFQRKTMTLLRDSNTNKPYERFYTTMRVGGEVSDFHATKFIKCA